MNDKIVLLNLSRSATQSTKNFVDHLYRPMKRFFTLSDYRFVDKQFRSGGKLSKKFPDEVNHDDLYFANEKANLFFDDPYCYMYEYLHKKIPDAQFILVTRDESEWANSFYRFVIANGSLGPVAYDYFNKCLAGTHEFDSRLRGEKDKYFLKQVYLKHTENVDNYFKGNEKYLKVSISDKDIAKKIANFLYFEYNEDMKFPKVDSYKKIMDAKNADPLWIRNWRNSDSQ